MGRQTFGIGDVKRHITAIFGPGTTEDEEGSLIGVIVRGQSIEDEHGKRTVPVPRVKPVVTKVQNDDGSSTVNAVFDASDERHARALVEAELRRAGITFDAETLEIHFEKAIVRRSHLLLGHVA